MRDQLPTPATLESIVRAELGLLDLGGENPIEASSYAELHNRRINDLSISVNALPTITDKATYEANQRARTKLVTIRTGLDKRRKALFDPVRRLKEEVDGYIGTTPESGLQGRIKALERVIEDKQAAWDAEQERIRQEEQRIIDERNQARSRRLVDAGMEFDGVAYRLLHVSIVPADVNRCSDPEFDTWFTQSLGPAIIAKKDADRQEQERIQAKEEAQREENERMRREFERQRQEQERMDRERTEIDAERARMKAEKEAMRRDRLIALGAEYDERGFYHVGGDLCQVATPLANLKEEDWIMAQEAVPRAAEKFKAMQEEKLLKVEMVRDRGNRLGMLGAERDVAGVWSLRSATATDHQLATMDADAWNTLLATFEAEEEREYEVPTDPVSDHKQFLYDACSDLRDAADHVRLTDTEGPANELAQRIARQCSAYLIEIDMLP